MHDLMEEIPMPFHFWRHQFAQHMLRKTDWNYALVAGLGHWTVETLERYYGKMDRKTRMEGASITVHQI
jgi:integrase